MKKLTGLFVIYLIGSIFSNSYAQQKVSFGYLQSYPLGGYASTDMVDGSFAEPGWGVMLENRVKMPGFPNGLYLGFHYSYQYNNFNSRAFESGINKGIGQDYHSLVSKSSYKPSVITLGPYYEFSPLNRLSIELRTGAGILITNLDPIVINIYDLQNTVVLSEVLRFQSQPAFTYLAGLTVGYEIANHVRLGAFLEHSFAKEKIKTTFDNIDGIGSEFSLIYINAGINLSFTFN